MKKNVKKQAQKPTPKPAQKQAPKPVKKPVKKSAKDVREDAQQIDVVALCSALNRLSCEHATEAYLASDTHAFFAGLTRTTALCKAHTAEIAHGIVRPHLTAWNDKNYFDDCLTRRPLITYQGCLLVADKEETANPDFKVPTIPSRAIDGATEEEMRNYLVFTKKLCGFATLNVPCHADDKLQIAHRAAVIAYLEAAARQSLRVGAADAAQSFAECLRLLEPRLPASARPDALDDPAETDLLDRLPYAPTSDDIRKVYDLACEAQTQLWRAMRLAQLAKGKR